MSNIGTLIDGLYALRSRRLELTKEVENMKSQETTMRQQIIMELDNIGLAKASGTEATVGITMSIQPEIEDWDAVHKYIRENDRFDLLQKRISVVAWRDLINEEGTLVPGTLVTEVRDISLTKAHR